MKNKPPGASPLTLLRTGKAASSALTFPVWQWKQREPDLRPCMGGRDGDKPQTGLPAQKVMNLKAREGKENLRAKVPQHHPHPVFKKKKRQLDSEVIRRGKREKEKEKRIQPRAGEHPEWNHEAVCPEQWHPPCLLPALLIEGALGLTGKSSHTQHLCCRPDNRELLREFLIVANTAASARAPALSAQAGCLRVSSQDTPYSVPDLYLPAHGPRQKPKPNYRLFPLSPPPQVSLGCHSSYILSPCQRSLGILSGLSEGASE